jgi:hypothetical protein
MLGSTLFAEQFHRACEVILADYAQLAAQGDDAASRYPQVKRHLDECPRCAQAYADLYQMISAADADEPAAAPSYPKFDLSFLRPPHEASLPDWTRVWQPVAQLGDQVSRLLTEIQVLVTQEVASFASLPGPLAPAWVAAPAARDKTGQPERQGQVLPIVSPEHDLALALTVGPVAGHDALLSLQVTQPSSGQPLNRIRVTLRDPERHILAAELTNLDGQVTFSRVGSGSYVIEIRHGGKSLELPITFKWQA